MTIFAKKKIKEYLKESSALPVKKLGQNFLIDESAIKKIISAAEINSDDTIIEVGPGTGALTLELAKKAGKVIAIEKDFKMVEVLKETLKDFKNIEIIHEDILKLKELSSLRQEELSSFKIVANLPFYIAAAVIRKFLESDIQPKEMVLIVQKEVGQRICPPRRARSSGEAGAKPPRMNILAVSVQFYANAKIISYIPKKSFWPKPKVDAAIIKITPNTKPDLATNLFFEIVKAGFSQPRKQILNNLSIKLQMQKEKVREWLLKNGVQPTQRPETLTVDNWIKLTKDYKI